MFVLPLNEAGYATDAIEKTSFLDYLDIDESKYINEKEVIFATYRELSESKMNVSNKDLISALLEKLQLENDMVKLDIYRLALEIVVQGTPDDVAP